MDALISEERGLTVERYAAAKGLDPAKLARWDMTTEPNPYRAEEGAVFDALGPHGTPCVAFRYLDHQDRLIRIKYRGQRGTVWDQRSGVPLVLYGLWWLPKVSASRPLLLVEGESDCHAGWMHGILALGLPGASTWRLEWAALFGGRAVYVWREPTLPGKKADAGRLMTEMIAAEVPHAKVIQPVGVKDLCELHQRSGDGFAPVFQTLVDKARPIRDVVVPKPSPRPDIRVWREPSRQIGRDAVDVARAKAVPIDLLLQRLGFELKGSGRERLMMCPWHDDGRKPSLKVNVEKGLWRCWGCGATGDAISFVQRLRGLSFPDAVRAVCA